MKITEKEAETFASIEKTIRDKILETKTKAEKDLEIDETDLDREVLRTPKLYISYLNRYTDELAVLKDLNSMKDRFRLRFLINSCVFRNLYN